MLSDAVFVPIDGGGLISGIAGYLKSVNPNIKMIGCLPANSPVMAESIKVGQIVEMETLPTLSDSNVIILLSCASISLQKLKFILAS